MCSCRFRLGGIDTSLARCGGSDRSAPRERRIAKGQPMSSRKGFRRSNGGASRHVSTVGIAVFYRPYRSAMLALLRRAPGLVPVDLGAVGEDIACKLKHLHPDAVLLD